MNQPQYPVQGRWVYQNDPELFHTLRRHTLGYLQNTLSKCLGKADDWLFDLAQKDGAVSGSPPLDAMRVGDRQRPGRLPAGRDRPTDRLRLGPRRAGAHLRQ